MARRKHAKRRSTGKRHRKGVKVGTIRKGWKKVKAGVGGHTWKPHKKAKRHDRKRR